MREVTEITLVYCLSTRLTYPFLSHTALLRSSHHRSYHGRTAFLLLLSFLLFCVRGERGEEEISYFGVAAGERAGRPSLGKTADGHGTYEMEANLFLLWI